MYRTVTRIEIHTSIFNALPGRRSLEPLKWLASCPRIRPSLEVAVQNEQEVRCDPPRGAKDAPDVAVKMAAGGPSAWDL
jgi:hypothetical protein